MASDNNISDELIWHQPVETKDENGGPRVTTPW